MSNLKNEYYTHSDAFCHHMYTGGCSFCGFFRSEKSVSKAPMSIDEQIAHFDAWAVDAEKYIIAKDRLIVAPNGSWFVEVPKEVRVHMYKYLIDRDVSNIKYECRATIFNSVKMCEVFSRILAIKRTPEEKIMGLAREKVAQLEYDLGEINHMHTVSFGLEVANDEDLRTLNKGCNLSDYVDAAREVHMRNGTVCANVLVAPPRISDPIRKAFETVRYAIDVMKADELHMMACIPMKGTQAHADWDSGLWNPISPTAFKEFKDIVIEKMAPDMTVRHMNMRVGCFTGSRGEFDRGKKTWTEEEKEPEREKVRKIFDEVFS